MTTEQYYELLRQFGSAEKVRELFPRNVKAFLRDHPQLKRLFGEGFSR